MLRITERNSKAHLAIIHKYNSAEIQDPKARSSPPDFTDHMQLILYACLKRLK